MVLNRIYLKNFRNFNEASFDFNRSLTIIIGENARGKTNLLESIYCLTSGAGFRESREEELMALGAKETTIEGEFADKNGKYDFRIFLRLTGKVLEKIFFANRTKRKSSLYQKETVKAILFSPQQIEIVTGPPDIRRRYFDKLLSGYDIDYKKKLTNFENALRRRNKILESYSNEAALKEELFFWDDYLIEQASYLTREREKYVSYLNDHRKIDSKKFFVKYVKNEMTRTRLDESFPLERRYRRTVIGPQKDDFEIYEEGNFDKNLLHFGSRSEQRLGVFWLKFNEINYHEEKFGKKPILLLDDIFSELDKKNKKLILDLITRYQTIVTTTEDDLINLSHKPNTVIGI
ncbi:DNA replication/repair protein RecF [Candidatus Roizmanbacteria bacterium]|nr:DNA replication/repair protein RecF [Candidatus Roizmanbacteria bacterium]